MKKTLSVVLASEKCLSLAGFAGSKSQAPAAPAAPAGGEKAADAIVEAAKDGPFLSKDDFRERTKASKTVIDMMADLNLLGDLPESNQISLFDFVS